MVDDLEEVLKDIAEVVYDKVKQFGISDRAYEKAMSEELMEREIPHEAHRKVFDERKGKYKFIDLYFPEHARFAKLKARKYITRTEIAELKEEELIMGIEGMIINFYNGISIRHSTSGRVRANDFDAMIGFSSESHRSKRMTLPQLSGSTSRLNDMNEYNFSSRHKSRYPQTAISISDDKDGFKNANKIFSLSCAAFFLSEGNRREFSDIFNDLLESMKFAKISIPDKFLEGPRMRTPDGEVTSIMKRAFSSKFKKDSEANAEKETPKNESIAGDTEE